MLYVLISLFVLTQPAPAPAPAADGLDSLIEKISKLRDQQKDLKQQEEKLLSDLRTKFKDLADRVDKLGATPAPPAPPAPPTPPTPPPPPADPFAVDLASLYSKEASSSKKVQILTLAALYRQAAKEANSPKLETCNELAALIHSFIDNAEGLGVDAVKPVRDRVLAELLKVAPDLNATLNDGLRAGIGSVYGRAAAILEGVAK